MSTNKNQHDVYHGNDGLAKNPQASSEQRHQGAEQRSGQSNEWHGQHGAYHNPTSSAQTKSAAMDKMQSLAKDAGKR